jgi:tRNA (guanine-N7-)-methyltransferase
LLHCRIISKLPILRLNPPLVESNSKRLLASYGRKRGRRLRTTKQDLFDQLLPNLDLELPENEMLLPKSVFPKAKSLWLEIGFGGGEHLAHQATNNPDVGIIGCEPYVNGIAGLLKHIDDHKIHNVRIWQEDARLVIDKLPDASVERVYILYPDPWPKTRHHKRRLVSTELLNSLSRIMRPGAQLRLATDDVDYCTWMLEHLTPHPQFTWNAKSCDDWLNPPAGWISTRYEQKALAAGRVPTYLNFTRI